MIVMLFHRCLHDGTVPAGRMLNALRGGQPHYLPAFLRRSISLAMGPRSFRNRFSST